MKPRDAVPTVAVDLRSLEDVHLRGLARYTMNVVRALHDRGDVNLIGFSFGELAHEVPIDVHALGTASEMVTEQARLVAFLLKRRVDVVFEPANRGLPFLAPCPAVLTLHDAVEWDDTLCPPPTGRGRLRFDYASVVSIAAADLVITVSRASAISLAEVLAIGPERIRVVSEAADPRFAQPVDRGEVEELVGRLGVALPYALYVGGFDAKKDVRSLLEAWCLADVPGGTLVLAGKLDERGRALADAFGSRADSLRWVGYVDDEDLAGLYRGARCFVFPAVAEGFGLPVAEAMTAGTPVIAARAGALPEVVGDAGILFTAGDVECLSTSLRRLFGDDRFRARLAAAALDRASAFSWADTAEQTAQVLAEASRLSPLACLAGRVARLRSWRRWCAPRPGP